MSRDCGLGKAIRRQVLAGLGGILIAGCTGEPRDLARPAAASRSGSPSAQPAEGRPAPVKQADPDFDARVARPAYTTAHPRVLVDEAHHNFHKASGRYKPFADLLTHDGYHVAANRQKFAAEELRKCDVLVIANALAAEPGRLGDPAMAQPAFTPDECDVVHDWVRRGGALLLITDHYPFGWAAKDLAQRFGVETRKVYTVDPPHSQGDPTRILFTDTNQLLRDHPITRGRDESERIHRVLTFTGQSLKGPEGSVAFLQLADSALDLTFPDQKPLPAGRRAQGLALHYGKGRVVVMGEATLLTALVAGPARRRLGMNVPGIDNRQLALNILHWLSGLMGPPGEPTSAPVPGSSGLRQSRGAAAAPR